MDSKVIIELHYNNVNCNVGSITDNFLYFTTQHISFINKDT